MQGQIEDFDPSSEDSVYNAVCHSLAEVNRQMDERRCMPPTTVEELMKEEREYADRLIEQLYKDYGSCGRLRALLEMASWGEIGDRVLLWVLGDLWTTCDDIGLHNDLLYNELFGVASLESTIPELMTDEEWSALDALPDELIIYRGCGPENMYGFSWTLRRDIAVKFPFYGRYFTKQPMLLTARIPKARAAALKLGRNEEEIIVFYDEEEPSISWTTELLPAPQTMTVAST